LQTAFFLEGENRANQVLITAHTAGNTVHGDLDGSTGHDVGGKKAERS
jgi:hypothetical protein